MDFNLKGKLQYISHKPTICLRMSIGNLKVDDDTQNLDYRTIFTNN